MGRRAPQVRAASLGTGVQFQISAAKVPFSGNTKTPPAGLEVLEAAAVSGSVGHDRRSVTGILLGRANTDAPGPGHDLVLTSKIFIRHEQAAPRNPAVGVGSFR